MKRLFLTIIMMAFAFMSFSQFNANVDFQESDLQFSADSIFDKVKIQNALYTNEIGKPELPYLVKTYLLPADAEVSGLSITGSSKQTISGNFYIYPAQPPVPVSYGEDLPFVQPDSATYNSANPYPAKIAEIAEDIFYQGYHIVSVAFYPLEYILRSA